MNYQKIYENLTAKDMIADYTEKHHIIPRCMGGSDDTTNIVRLTPEAHYVAHQLLVKIYPTNAKLVFAVVKMTGGYKRNNKIIGWIKKKHAAAMSNIMKGRTFSIEHRAKLSAAKKGTQLSDLHRSNIQKALSYQPKSAETRAKLSASHKGKIVSIETRNKMRMIKKTVSIETRTKLSIANKGKIQIKVVCPHCNKEGGQSLMTRYHFNNCKYYKGNICGQ